MTKPSPPTWGSEDRRWMRRAMRLASLSLGYTAPNPGVGCVIVRDGHVLGEGRHKKCGEAHGEIQALTDVAANGYDPAGATVYVTLAPCTSQGRTPACSTALIRAGVRRVVAAIADPIQEQPDDMFAQAGIAYAVGCEQHLAERLHGGWLSRVQSGFPRMTGKWAMTLDGFIADQHGGPIAISSPVARARSRRRRRAYDAIVVGAGTVVADNPQLLATAGRHPSRVVISSGANLALDSRLVATISSAPLIMIHDHRATAAKLDALKRSGVKTVLVDDTRQPAMVKKSLGNMGFNDVLVEGGAVLHGAFLAANAYDRLEIEIGAKTIGSGIPVAQLASASEWYHESPSLRRGTTQCLGLHLNNMTRNTPV